MALGVRMAAMKAMDPRVTYAELEQWPDDGRRYELYSGEAIVVPAPLPIHQIAALRIYSELDEYAGRVGGLALAAPLDIVFSQYDVLQPDVVLFEAEGKARIDPTHAIRVVPNLVVEVLSRATAARDRGRKLHLFEHYGVPEYWIVDPQQRTIEVLQRGAPGLEPIGTYEETSTLSSGTLPGLQLQVAKVFRI